MHTKEDTPTKRKPGRPPRPPEDRKRTNVTLRLDDELRRQLLDEAAKSGRSFNAEIGHRLRLSLAGESREAGLSLDLRAILQAVASRAVLMEALDQLRDKCDKLRAALGLIDAASNNR